MSKAFWTKVEHMDFIAHYIRMTPEERAQDVEQSLQDIATHCGEGKSFGAFLVREADNRIQKVSAKNSENAKARWANNPTKPMPTIPKNGKPKKLSLLSGPMPESKEEVLDFAMEFGLNEADVINCWYATAIERDNHDKDGNPITDWKAFLITWCKTANKNRNKS